MSTYQALREAITNQVPAVVVTVVKGASPGAKLLILPNRTEGSLGLVTLDEMAGPEARRALADEQSVTRTYETEQGNVDLFFEVFPPPPLLLIFGAVHVAQALTRVAKQLGFRVVVSDARATLLTEDRFPEADLLIRGWPEDALEQVSIDRNTYVAILSHDPKFDEPALVGAAATEARYIGAIGSRKTNADRKVRLIAAGLDEESIARIRGPIGLDIGASTPEEMAIAILAEIIAIRHGRSGGSLASTAGQIRARV